MLRKNPAETLGGEELKTPASRRFQAPACHRPPPLLFADFTPPPPSTQCSMNIPQKLLERMVTFDLKGDDDHEIKATVVENETVLQKAMSKMKSLLDNDGDWIVGFDVKSGTVQRSISSGNIMVGQDILVLCVKHQCVIILMGRFGNLPSCLENFLCDGSICFVGRNAKAKIGMLKHRYSDKNVLSFMENGVEVAPFTARVLMLPKLKGCCNLALLGKEIGLVIKDHNVNIGNGTSDWVDLCLSEDDILNAIDEAYKCCKIARFACESLPEDRKLCLKLKSRCSISCGIICKREMLLPHNTLSHS